MAQPTTVVTPAYPYVEVEFAVVAFRSSIILAYVDTGFDGYLIIPAKQTSLLGPPQFFAPGSLEMDRSCRRRNTEAISCSPD